MKKLFVINCFLLMFGISIFGQTTNSDLKQLRKEAGLPASVAVSDDNISFPASKTLKIYLAIKHDKRAAKDFANWVAQWNQTNAAQYGRLQIVDRVTDADIAAIQFQYGAARIVREDSAQLKIGKVRRDNDDFDDKIVLNKIGNSTARVETSAKSLPAPLYSYLIVRGKNSDWAVDYSRVDPRTTTKYFPDLLLQAALADKMKNR